MMSLAIPFLVALLAGHEAPPCGPADAMFQHLKEAYGEVPLTGGVIASGKFMTFLLGNPDKGNWTMLDVSPTGIACLRRSGDGLHLFDEPPPTDEGEPT